MTARRNCPPLRFLLVTLVPPRSPPCSPPRRPDDGARVQHRANDQRRAALTLTLTLALTPALTLTRCGEAHPSPNPNQVLRVASAWRESGGAVFKVQLKSQARSLAVTPTLTLTLR